MMNKEKLTQLLDGELSAAELEGAIDSLLADPELQKSWHIQHAVRAAIREDRAPVSSGVTNKVFAALAHEPAIMAPDNIRPHEMPQPATQSDGNILPFAAKPPGRILAYTAIAASLAALVFVAYHPERNTQPSVADNRTEQAERIQPEMQAMIVQHGEFSGAAALNGLVAYAKVVNGISPDSAR